jgi:hypothetical protein
MNEEQRRLRRRRQRQAKKNAIRAVRAQGCVCDVEIHFDRPDVPGARVAKAVGIPNLAVLHDDWCPFLRVIEERQPGLARSQALIYRPDQEAP